MQSRPRAKFYHKGTIHPKYTGNEVELLSRHTYKPSVLRYIQRIAIKKDMNQPVQRVSKEIHKRIMQKLKNAPRASVDQKRYYILKHLEYEIQAWGFSKQRVLEASDETIEDLWEMENCPQLVLRSMQGKQMPQQ